MYESLIKVNKACKGNKPYAKIRPLCTYNSTNLQTPKCAHMIRSVISLNVKNGRTGSLGASPQVCEI